MGRSRSDLELVALTQVDPEAFGEFYRRHERAIVSYFMHRCRSAELAVDLTAETFARAFGSLGSFDADRGQPRAWLFGIAGNVLARSLARGRVEDEARTRYGMQVLVIDDELAARIETTVDDGDRALGLLDGLPEPLRAAVAGRVLDEREYSELAQALECSQCVVRQRVHRGLARIRKGLEVKR